MVSISECIDDRDVSSGEAMFSEMDTNDILQALELCFRCPLHSGFPLAFFEKAFVLPARHGQFSLLLGSTGVLGAVTWARPKADVASRFQNKTLTIPGLTDEDIIGGEDAWLIDFVAPGLNPAQSRLLLKAFRQQCFPDLPIKLFLYDSGVGRAEPRVGEI